MILTKELLAACRSERSGTFTAETIKHFGLTYNSSQLKKGWTYRLIGTEITEDSYNKALEGRFVFRKKSKVPEIKFVQESLFD